MYGFEQQFPTPDEFAELVAESLINQGSRGKQLSFDRQGFSLQVKDEFGRLNKNIFLGTYYEDYCQSTVLDREQVLLRASTSSPAPPVNAHLETVLSGLLPQVKERWSVERMRLEQKALHPSAEMDLADIPHQVVAEHFAVVLTAATPSSRITLKSSHFAFSQISFDQALQRAVKNLRSHPHTRFQSLAHADTEEMVLHSCLSKDEFGTARILLKDSVSSLPVAGDHVILVLSPNYTIVTGTQSERGLMYAYSELRTAQKEAGGMPPFPILLRSEALQRYRIPDTSLWQHFFREMELRYLSNICRSQKELLDGDLHHLIPGCSVAEYELARDDNGKMFSYCAVSERSVPALVPKTDFILFQNKNGRAASGSFTGIKELYPELFEHTSHYPSRYLVAKFPSATQLAEIGLDEVFE